MVLFSLPVRRHQLSFPHRDPSSISINNVAMQCNVLLNKDKGTCVESTLHERARSSSNFNTVIRHGTMLRHLGEDSNAA